mmetsp:Transcript_5423/g.15969  ORF Transcript_5423/g.15969 Transcript_5423/m.15969 type:complete len:287 (-) Transcript_5423:26-886(-)
MVAGALRPGLAVGIVVAAAVAAHAVDYSPDSAWRAVQFSGAAYCCGMAMSGCGLWDCRSCKGNLTVTEVTDSGTDARGFVGYDSDTATVVVGFSGTDPLSIQNWIDDIDTVKVDYPGCDGCEVHKGFYETYLSVQSQVQSAVAQYLALHPEALGVELTGHSLGAALAQHAALDLQLAGYQVLSLYNFGQPRTGNLEFTDFFSSQISPVFRVTHHKDPVPHLPFENWGFHHEPLEVFYNRRNTDFHICDGSGEDSACADQYALDLDVVDHLTYLDFDFTANYLSCKL